MAEYHIVVLDVGKTNKKLLIYDDRLVCVNPDEEGVQFGPVEIDDLLCDDMASIHTWMVESLRRAAERYDDIRAVSISTHGATLALLGDCADRVFPGDGGLVFPIVSYEHDAGPQYEEMFFDDIGMTPEEAQAATGTARFGWFINSGRSVHFLQHSRPEQFAEVTCVLQLPQYLGYLLTGVRGAEPTFVGCHTYLLDAGGERYSTIAERLGAAEMMPPLPFANTWDVLGTLTPEMARATGLAPDCVVTMGVHDSNAALVPYFAKGLKDFVVQDSGTWIVTMAPCAEASFADEELGKEVFFNRSIYNGPVKTTIFRGGSEFDYFRRSVLPGLERPDGVEISVLAEITSGREAFSLPTIERGSGMFPDSVARLEGLDTVFRDAMHAWHTVDLGLAVQGYCAMVMAAGRDVREAYIEGNVGRHNPVYRSVISSLLPRATVRIGSMGGAPFGAAVLGVAAVEGVRPEDLGNRFPMELQTVPKLGLDTAALRAYVDAFLERVR